MRDDGLTVVYKSVWPICGNCVHWRAIDEPTSGQCMAITDEDADTMGVSKMIRGPVRLMTHQEQSPCPLPPRDGVSRWEQRWLTVGVSDG